MAKREYKHIRVQKEGRIRDNYTCQICGATEGAQGHHLIDYQFGGAAEEDNIVTLCAECHQKVHGGLIDLMSF